MKNPIFWVLLITVVLLKAFFIEGIATKALYDYDEARYAEVAKNILRTGEVLVPLAGGPDDNHGIVFKTLPNGEDLYPYFWKPPLHTWLLAISYSIFGISEFTTRLLSLLFAFGATFVLYKFAKQLFSTAAAQIAVLIFISTNDFGFISTQGIAETQLAFFTLLTLYFAYQKTTKSAILAGLFLGLAIMTKSFATFWIPLIALPLLISNNWKESAIRIASFIATSCIVVIPWHLYMYLRFKEAFIEYYFLVNTTGRALNTPGNAAPTKWYLIYMLDQWKPFIFIIPIFISNIIKDVIKKDKAIWILLFWMAVVFIPFSIFKSKVWWYIFPLWAPFSMLLGHYLSTLFVNKNFNRVLVLLLSLFTLHSFWQLNVHHIPMKPFAGIVVLIAVLGYLFDEKLKKLNIKYPYIISLVVLILVANNFAINMGKNRGDFNKDLRTLAQRNTNLTNVAFVNQAYEAFLFYSNVGNIAHDPKSAQYIFMNLNSYNPKDTTTRLLDKEGIYIIVEKKK